MSPLVLRNPDDIVTGRRRHKADTEWHALLNKAKSKPGRWWEVEPPYDSVSAARSAAYDINAGRNQAIPDGEWEAASRQRFVDDGGTIGILFIKYLGE